MKYSLLFLSIITLLIHPVKAQNPGKSTYPLIIVFQSVCCGVPTDSAVKIFIRSFKKQQSIKKITAYHIGPLGREGEYFLAFKLNELNKKQMAVFISGIKKIKTLPIDRGLFDFKFNTELDPALMPKRTSTTESVF